MSGQSIEQRSGSHRPRVDPEKLGPSRERLGNGRIEVRFANLERDAGRLAELFNQPSTIEHLSGIAPIETPPGVDVKKYGQKFPEYRVLIAKGTDVGEYYQERPNLIPLVAEEKEKGVIGTVTVEKSLGGPGLIYAGVSRIAVDENERGRGIGENLLRSANALIFTDRSAGGLGCVVSQAGVIKIGEGGVLFGIDEKGNIKTGEDLFRELVISSGKYTVPTMEVSQDVFRVLKIFNSKGYIPRREISYGNCVSWDNRLRRFIKRDVILVRKEIKYTTSEPSKYFPQSKKSS